MDSNETTESMPNIADDDVTLDHIPDEFECWRLMAQFNQDNFWPNVWHINERGNVDLLRIEYAGASIVQSWV